MNGRLPPSIVVCSLHHLSDAVRRYEPQRVVSILSDAERTSFSGPAFGNRIVLELRFDDLAYGTDRFVVPAERHIESLIEFAFRWGGSGNLLVHCRAGTSRSVAGAAIAAAAIGRKDLAERVLSAKSYFKANQRMLEIADRLLVPSPGLKGLAQSIPLADKLDEWGPIGIPLGSREQQS
jgi:predicted protein tyrosine phosphatase